MCICCRDSSPAAQYRADMQLRAARVSAICPECQRLYWSHYTALGDWLGCPGRKEVTEQSES